MNYLLPRKEYIEVKCRTGRSCLRRDIYGRVVRNYYFGFINYFDCSENEIYVNNQKLIIRQVDNYLDFGIAKFKSERQTILEIFITRVYEKLNVCGRFVVDVGAYVGDSAIYFTLKGASKVIAIEPHPGAYEEMLENIRLNNMGDKIIPINAGLASKPGFINVEGVDIESTAVRFTVSPVLQGM
jgi:hypothetical protein